MKKPLCVDLDNTLIRTDILFESIITYLKIKPFGGFRLFLEYLKGRQILKSFLASHVSIDFDKIPVNQEIENYCKLEAKKGRPIYLVTGSHGNFLKNVKKRFPFISKVYSSDNQLNLTGKKKANLLTTILGKGEFDYIGDARSDFHVYKVSQAALIAKKSLFSKTKTHNLEKVFLTPKNQIINIIKLLRPVQWVKNFLIYVPLILAHKYSDLDLLSRAGIIFIVFSLLASSIYVFNDLFDIDNDRSHPIKKNRALASGKVSIPTACFVILILLVVVGTLIYYFLSNIFYIFLLYFVLNLFYSTVLKTLILVDVFLLAIFYTLRLYSGALGTQIEISPWLLSFSVFIFFSLGFLKRYLEIQKTFTTKTTPRGRAYLSSDLSTLYTFGVGTSLLSTVVFCQYIFSMKVKDLYSHPQVLWVLCLIYFYWICTLWFKAARDELKEDDPIRIVIKDRITYVCAGLGIIMFYLAI